jgi:Flp pilus assembly protein TadG
VEFAILGMVFMMVVGGVLDFGHAYYIRQVVTNASREGARYGVAHTQLNPTSLARIPPSSYSPTIQNYVINNYISQTLVANLNPQVTPGGTGYTSGAMGDPLRVTVSATKSWWFVGFILGTSSTTISATTVMRLE